MQILYFDAIIIGLAQRTPCKIRAVRETFDNNCTDSGHAIIEDAKTDKLPNGDYDVQVEGKQFAFKLRGGKFSSRQEALTSRTRNRTNGMKYRIIVWAGIGFLIAGFWAVYFFQMAPITATERMWTLSRLTCPIAFFGSYPIRLSWVLLANAATYALVGLGVETLRRQLKPAK